MRKKLGYIALSAALLAVVSGIAVAQATTSAISAPETIVLQGNTVKSADVNVGDKAWGAGDSFMQSTKLFDETGVTQLGTGHIQCTVMPGKGWVLCNASLFIHGRGEIMAQGAIHQTDGTTPFDVPIVGGTGDFENVRGYGHIQPISNNSETDTLYLLP